MNIDFNKILNSIKLYIYILLLAVIVDTGLYIFFPKTMPLKDSIDSSGIKYLRYDIKNSFKDTQIKKKKEIKKTVKKEYQLLSNIILKAVYATSNSKNGWIIIASKNDNKTYILSVGDNFKQYYLTYVYPKYVLFKKGNKEYKLTLTKKDSNSKYTISSTAKQKVEKKEDIVDYDNSIYSIKKDTLQSYITNPKKIWKNITINEIRRNGKIEGFRIDHIRRNSIFRKLGLQKGDIIKEVNNIKLKSYKDAFDIYRQIDTIDSLHFVIERKDKEMELDYEIR